MMVVNITRRSGCVGLVNNLTALENGDKNIHLACTFHHLSFHTHRWQINVLFFILDKADHNFLIDQI
jgi:hypothetical protein